MFAAAKVVSSSLIGAGKDTIFSLKTGGEEVSRKSDCLKAFMVSPEEEADS